MILGNHGLQSIRLRSNYEMTDMFLLCGNTLFSRTELLNQLQTSEMTENKVFKICFYFCGSGSVCSYSILPMSHRYNSVLDSEYNTRFLSLNENIVRKP